MIGKFYKNPKKLLAEGEEDAVRTRLAAGEVNSLAGRNIMNGAARPEAAVKQRIISGTGVGLADAEDIYRNMIRRVQDADLTINFSPEDLFKYLPTDSFKNAFERNHQGADYMRSRDRVENKLFNYNAPETNFNVREVINRIKTRGSYEAGQNSSFDPRIRPRFGALNIFNLKQGAAARGLYGQSHLILKDYIKQRCTFTSTDSFNLMDADKSVNLANLFYLDKVIMELNDQTFNVLCAQVMNQPLRKSDSIDLLYVEAQIHTEILFSRDVKKIRLQKIELGLDSDDSKIFIENIAVLATRNNILVEVFD